MPQILKHLDSPQPGSKYFPPSSYRSGFEILIASPSAGVLSNDSGSLVIKPCTAAEVKFYEVTQAHHPAFAAHMPTFFGTLQLGDPLQPSDQAPTHNRHSNIVLSNIGHGFERPCILDVKLGAQLWGEDASLEKRARLDKVSDETTSRPMGMRVAGMKVYRGTGEEAKKDPAVDETGYRVYDKYYARVFTKDNVIDTIIEYFTSEISQEQVKLVAGRLLKRLTEIREMLEEQESRMYSASLLFCYEGSKTALEEALKELDAAKNSEEEDEEEEEEDDDGDDKKLKKVEDLKLIDFAHASWTPGQGPDKNALQGVRSMEKLLAQIVGI